MPTVYLALIIPLIVTGIFYYLKRNEFVWWEFFLPFLVTLVFIVISKFAIEQVAVSFDEYWGSTIVSITEEEPYNYWKVEECSRQVADGTDKDGHTKYKTEYYDCSHQEDVGPSWSATTNIGESISITDKQYDELVAKFGTGKRTVDEHKNYAPNDEGVWCRGTKFEGRIVGNKSYVYNTTWNGSDDTRKSYVSKHTYKNKIKASDLTIFDIKMVNKSQADSMGLFQYPDKIDGLEYPTILGGNVSKNIQEKFRNLNGKFGTSNQLRLWILVFENKPMSIAQYQENYWVKGNKNELVICIGKKGDEIQWSHAFSWALSNDLTVEVQNKVFDLFTYKDSIKKSNLPPVLPVNKDLKKKVLGKVGEKLPDVIPISNQTAQVISPDQVIKVKSKFPVLNEQTWNDYYNYLNENLHRFKRREFKEFDYISVEPSTGWVIFVYILSLLVSVGMSIFVIKNDIKQE
jgi:hypothetical protein